MISASIKPNNKLIRYVRQLCSNGIIYIITILINGTKEVPEKVANVSLEKPRI